MEVYEEVNKVIDDIVTSLCDQVEDKGWEVLEEDLKSIIIDIWGNQLVEAIISEVEGRVCK